MTTSIRRLSRDFAVYGIGEFVVKAFSLVTLPLYTHLFAPAQFGVLSYVLTLGGLLSAVLVLGGDSAYARFFFEAKTLEQRQTITSTWICFLAAWSAVVCLVLLPQARAIAELTLDNASATPLLIAILLAAPVTLTNVMCGQVLRNQFRSAAYTTLNVASTVVLVGMIVIGTVVLRLGLLGVVGGTLVAQVAMLPVRLWTARSMLRPRFSSHVLRDMLRFGIPLVPASLAYWVFVSSDRIVLEKLSTVDQLGLYGVANSLVSLATLAIYAFGQAWSPHAFRLYEEDRTVAASVYGRVMTYLLVGFGLLAVGLTVFGPELLTILTGPAYLPAAMAIAPLAIAIVAMASTQVTAGGISIAKKTQYLAVFAWVAAGANLGLNLVLDGPFGMVGAAWATTASYVLLTLLYLGASQRLWPASYEVRRSLTAIALILAFVLVADVLPDGLTLAALGVKTLYCLAFVGGCILFKALDRREVDAVRSVLRRDR